MDKIFREIKRAIEEEMRNAEGSPPPGRQREGGRRAQEYAEWLKQEQDRLRGGRQPQNLQEVPVESTPLSEQEWESESAKEWEVREARRQERAQPRRPVEERPTPTRQESTTQYQRSEARHDRQTAGAYRQRRGGSYLQRQVHQLLRSHGGMRQAFVLREIVSKPVSLRGQDDHLIS